MEPSPAVNASEAVSGKVLDVHQSSEFLVLMSTFMVVALIGNTMVLLMIWRSGGCRRPVSIFVVSLALGDIMIAVLSMSTEIFWEWIGQGAYGNIVCKLSTYIQCLLFVGTSFILVSMSFDRYEAICKPLVFSRSVQRSRKMILVSFLLAALVAIPQLFIFLQVEVGVDGEGKSHMACRSHGYTASWQRKLNVTWLAICVFVAPLCFMTLCGYKIARAVWRTSSPNPRDAAAPLMIIRQNNASSPNSNHLKSRKTMLSQAKTKTIQLTVCILLAHLICWTPYFTVNLLNVWTDYRMKDQIPRAVGSLAQCAAWFSSCVNPLIYALFNLSVQKLQASCCRKGNVVQPPGTPVQLRLKFSCLDGSSGASVVNGAATARRTITLSNFSQKTKGKMTLYAPSLQPSPSRSPSAMVRLLPSATSLDVFVPHNGSFRSI
ncbi:hypothetical protein RvY_03498 [Ramazzottius varieornatus]|uniref:G-protein coupled receptors family 1 profile domain-containing protein n=1 Tax=Ramazzottius varieornatus TaxID=947166 RepID=A0A1D1UTZ8_RAMVA|nr:hypothetical protein RvY_03498 [Ramazzottius varieornatus]